MLVTAQKVSQQVRPLRIAIVEDNATARLNLRSHLIGIDNFDIASYSNGNELRNGLRLNNFDLVIMDFHLGQTKNGVEWILQLTDRKLFKPSTGLVFITSDSMPQTIGQILDLHPDFILIKPYTIKSLRTNIAHYLKLRKEVLPVLSSMDNENHHEALSIISAKLDEQAPKRFRNDFLKLKGRLLIEDKQFDEAIELYSSVLKRSSNVLWAHWGLIKSEYNTGKWHECRELLNNLISQSLTKDKAFEWLASLSIGREDFKEAEAFLDNIKEGDLSIQATRLKVLAYTMQDKNDNAQALLEKKFQSNLSVKERMSEYAMELARFHIQMAETVIKDGDISNPTHIQNSQETSLHEARKLIGKAARSNFDQQTEIQKDYMLALAYIIEGENNRAQELLDNNPSTKTLTNAKPATMIDAVKVWFGVGQHERAKEILQDCDEYLLQQDNHIDRLICSELISDIEESHYLQKERALQSNDRGMLLYQNKEINQAMQCFYKSYKMFPGIPAFALNFLQCMADIQQFEFKELQANSIYQELLSVALSEKNQLRLEHIKIKLGF